MRLERGGSKRERREEHPEVSQEVSPPSLPPGVPPQQAGPGLHCLLPRRQTPVASPFFRPSLSTVSTSVRILGLQGCRRSEVQGGRGLGLSGAPGAPAAGTAGVEPRGEELGAPPTHTALKLAPS